MRRLTRRLGWKIGLLLSIVLLLVMTLLSVGDYLWQRSVFLENLEDHIARETWIVSILLRNVDDPVKRQSLIMELARGNDQDEQDRSIHEIFILDDQVTVQISSEEKSLGQHMATDSILSVLRDGQGFASGVMQHGDHPSFYGVAPIYPNGDPSASPIGAVHVAEPLQPIQAYLRQFLTQRLLFLGLVTSILIVLVNLLISKTVQSPLRALSRTMKRVHHGDLQTRVPVKSADELGQIGLAFNSMIEAVQESQQVIEKERSRLALMYDISRRLANTMDWEEVMDLLVGIPSKIVDAVACTFLSFDERNGLLNLERAWGLENSHLIDLELELQRLSGSLPCLTCRPRLARASDGCALLPDHLVNRSDAGSILCLHLAQGEQTVGFLNVYLSQTSPPSPEQRQLLDAIAGEMAAVVAAAQLRARELALLTRMEQTVRTPLNLKEMLEQILTQTREASQVKQGAILLINQEKEEMETVVLQGIEPGQLSALQALAFQAVARNEPVLISEPLAPGPARPRDDEPTSVLAVPLVLDGTTLGILLLADQRPGLFAQRQVTLLSAIASQTALIVRNSQLYGQLESHAIFEERNRLAREIHDGLVQTLGFLKLQMARMQGWADKGDIQRLRIEVSNLREVLEEAYADARDAITGLGVDLGQEDSLESILDDYVQSYSARYLLPVELSVEGNGSDLPPTAILHLLRIAQEGLANVRKHAHATQAWIHLLYQDGGLVMTISDDGRGIETQTIQGAASRGLHFMRERAESLGGLLEIHPRHPQGTQVRVTL